MNGRHVGYVRVSTHEQNTVRQLADCKVNFWKVYEEKASGKNTDRPELQDCQKWLSLFEQIRLIFRWNLRHSYIAIFTWGICS
ncbi:phage-related protein, partial [Desulfomicrobium macestii]